MFKKVLKLLTGRAKISLKPQYYVEDVGLLHTDELKIGIFGSLALMAN